MRSLKNIDKFFYPRDFKGDPYGWLTNQLSHTFGSLIACLFMPYWFVGSFWLVWEARHFYKTRNLVDMLEDLLYELNGLAFWFFFFVQPEYVTYYALLYVGITISILIQKK